MNPSQETCRQLTIYLGEKWHHLTDKCVVGVWKHWIDCDCGERFVDNRKASDHVINRTFTLPDDLFAVYGKIYAEGKWEDWEWYCEQEYISRKFDSEEFWVANPFFTAWLFCLAAPSQIGERMEMAAAFLKEKGR